MKNQFETLQPWMKDILGAIKKDIKTEHLGSDLAFYKTHFGNRPQNRLTVEEIFNAYEKVLLKGEDENLSEWVVNRWVFKHGDVYSHFEERLSQLQADFDELKALTVEQSEQILKGSFEAFGAIPVYLFSALNGVVFPDSIFAKLRAAAETEAASNKTQAETTAQQLTLEQTIERMSREMTRLQEKYETKLAGVQKKYATDTEALKKQIRALQKRLNP